MAFAEAPALSADRVASHRGCLECEELRESFGGRHWSDLPADVIRYQREALVLLTTEAFRAYLPAYMLLALRSDDPANADVQQYTLFSLAPEERERRHELIGRIASWSAAEIDAVVAYLRAVAADRINGFDDEINEALRIVWKPAAAARSGA